MSSDFVMFHGEPVPLGHGTDRIQSESTNSVTTIQALEDKEAPDEEKGRRYLPRN